MGDKKRILIVDDDLYTRDLYKETLSGAGFDVVLSNDGVDGLTQLQEGGFDLVLLDTMMPKMDGLAVLMKLREKPPGKPNGPIIICTNLARDTVMNQALAAGAHACLIKTDMNPDQLVEKVHGFLEK